MRIAVLAVALASGLVLANASAAGATPIHPNQHFVGVVTGVSPSASPIVTLGTVCGRTAVTGRVAAHQTLAVHAAANGAGYTGPFDHVYAWFEEDSSANGPVQVVFSRYDIPQTIPNTIRVPCTGTGTVTFSSCPHLAPCAYGWLPMQVTVRFAPKSPALG
jgi:hypothetical protein